MTIKSVNIPASQQHGGLALTAARVNWTCPKCGERRGEVFDTISYDGSRRLHCDGWRNPCGHIDKYSDVIAEAIANGLNDDSDN